MNSLPTPEEIAARVAYEGFKAHPSRVSEAGMEAAARAAYAAVRDALEAEAARLKAEIASEYGDDLSRTRERAQREAILAFAARLRGAP